MAQFQFKNKAFAVADDSVLAQTYSLTEVIALTGVSRQTLYNWTKKGEIRFVKSGREIRIFKSELEPSGDAAPAAEVQVPQDTAPAAEVQAPQDAAPAAESKRKRKNKTGGDN